MQLLRHEKEIGSSDKKEEKMGKNIIVIVAVVILFVSGLVLVNKFGMGGSCCSTHHVHGT